MLPGCSFEAGPGVVNAKLEQLRKEIDYLSRIEHVLDEQRNRALICIRNVEDEPRNAPLEYITRADLRRGFGLDQPPLVAQQPAASGIPVVPPPIGVPSLVEAIKNNATGALPGFTSLTSHAQQRDPKTILAIQFPANTQIEIPIPDLDAVFPFAQVSASIYRLFISTCIVPFNRTKVSKKLFF